MTVKELFSELKATLADSYSPDESRLLAGRLIEHYMDLAPAARVFAAAKSVPDAVLTQMQDAVSRLRQHMPLQYVTGKAYFMDLVLEVNPSVLIPRPETEQLTALIISDIESSERQKPISVLDIGTGSGCIAIALKKRFPESETWACDISDEALATARRNALALDAEISFVKLDILDASARGSLPQFDVIVSNPPYVTENEKLQMLLNVLDYEPHNALFVPDTNPLLFYNTISAFAGSNLKPGGMLWFEINEMFGDQLKTTLETAGFTGVNIFSDFREKKRFLQASRKSVNSSL